MTAAPSEPAGGGPTAGKAGADRSPPWLGRLAFWSAASALASVVPVPFLDDHLVRVTRRSMVRELGRERGLGLAESEVQLLAGPGSGLRFGCTFGLLLAIAVKGALMVVKRVFRSIFFWLAIRDAANAASFTFHEGFLLRRALADLSPSIPTASGAAPQPPRPPRPEVQRLRTCVEQVIGEVDPRPVRQAFRRALRGSYRLTRATARRVKRVLLGVREEQAESRTLEEAVPPSLVERLGKALDAQGAYLEDLTRRIERALATPPPLPVAVTKTAATPPVAEDGGEIPTPNGTPGVAEAEGEADHP
jgi:hypothetical protein